jgi:hypothetical protein
MGIDPLLDVLKDHPESPVGEEAMLGARVLPIGPVRVPNLGKETASSVRRHHTVIRAMQEQERD